MSIVVEPIMKSAKVGLDLIKFVVILLFVELILHFCSKVGILVAVCLAFLLIDTFRQRVRNAIGELFVFSGDSWNDSRRGTGANLPRLVPR